MTSVIRTMVNASVLLVGKELTVLLLVRLHSWFLTVNAL